MCAAPRLILASAFACLGAVLPNNGSGPSLAALPRLELVANNIELPTAMAVDPHGNVYVAVYGRCGLYDSIVKLSPNGSVQKRLEFTLGSRPGQFEAISGIAADAAGNIYAADWLNDRVQKLSPSGMPLAVWKGNRPGGPGLSHPQGITLDSRGNLFVADQSGRIRKFSPGGRLLATWR